MIRNIHPCANCFNVVDIVYHELPKGKVLCTNECYIQYFRWITLKLARLARSVT